MADSLYSGKEKAYDYLSFFELVIKVRQEPICLCVISDLDELDSHLHVRTQRNVRQVRTGTVRADMNQVHGPYFWGGEAERPALHIP